MTNNGIHFDLIRDRYQGSSHTILINPDEDRELLSFLQAGRDAYFQARNDGYGNLPPKFAAKYVHDFVPSSSENSGRIHRKRRLEGTAPYLGEFLTGGECREKNLLLHLLLAQLGYPSEFLSGTVWREYEKRYSSWPNFSNIFVRPHHDIWMLGISCGGFETAH
ncbi:MAG: hypothetical protein J4400_02050 [Candidatus Aenigmarchaeota archaeon]|nr:hypothetical protein [Candidatus Aenigmarchaeota archaeon]